MYSVARLNRRAFCAASVRGPFIFIAALTSGPAIAAIADTAFISNNFGYNFDPSQMPASNTGGSDLALFQSNRAGGAASDLAVNYTATVENGGFFFLHDNYCVGTCATSSSTVIGFAVTNTGTSAVNVRFDSQITPGHLAKIYDGGGSAAFDFSVLRYGDGLQTLYNANGGVNSDGIYLNTGNLTFNGQNRQTGANFDLLDWDTTNLSVNIGTLAAGATTFVFYTASYSSSAQANCTDILVCGGNQVVFGDPRNNGGTNLANFLGGLDAAGGRAVIGADYGKVFVPYRFVDANDPFSFPTPPGQDPQDYDPLYKPHPPSVPEPATWAMMIGGFGLMGAAMRRRRIASVTFA